MLVDSVLNIIGPDGTIYFTSKENYLLVATGFSLNIYDMTEPFAPELVGYYEDNMIVGKLEIVNNYCFGQSGGRLNVYDLTEIFGDVEFTPLIKLPLPASLMLSAFPNPFNSSTTIEYRVGANSNSTTLSLYDLQGRLVQTLVNERLTPGKYRHYLRASDFPSGSYIIALDGGHLSKSINTLTVIK